MSWKWASIRIELYWLAWLIIMATAAVINLVVDGEGTALAAGYMLCSWVPVMIVNAIEGHAILRYMRANHSQRAERLLAEGALGRLVWVYSDEAYGDSELKRLKSQLRSFHLLAVTIFITMAPFTLFLLW
jgi:hypothetical protein